ncbi:iron-enterobactin transporter permease [Citricoccus zhacaiensis]|uniref:Iron-enterobactin transporter permease n=1 Tax=Citricoccus zhacaiensis TaxID=489142 RepID=A0ABQ2LYP8_9MICC|nr:iron chelate uptake ABC transporter family permease subunit [Citricoccus zhacaiensis]GGO44487.1 iron-enterobactin transporter permease [Citricoccus zhacaiensis]
MRGLQARAGTPKGTLTIRRGRFSARTSVRSVTTIAVISAGVVALMVWATTLGSYAISPAELWGLVEGTAPQRVHTVVVEWRLPRIVAAVVFGIALGISGAVFQSLTRNPLGSPDIIGFASGAYTGVVVTLLLGATGYAARGAGALIGGLLTALAVYLLAFRRGIQGFRLIIIGIALSAFLDGINTWFTAKVDVDLALHAAVWGAGSLGAVNWTSVGIGSAVLAVLLVAAPEAQRRMRRLELGDDAAAALGVPVEPTKLALILIGVAATALVTAAAGPIAFIALAAPQIARRLTGQGASVDLAGSAAVGAALLLGADLIALHAVPGVPLPTGAVTICIGGGYLVWLLVRESRRERSTA